MQSQNDAASKPDTNPGPGQYNPQHGPNISKKSDPLYSFGKDNRKGTISDVPGPGSYEVKNNVVVNKQPSFSMLSRRQLLAEKNPVGPGHYESSFYTKEGSPSYSLKGRSSEKTQLKPGPGQYEIPSDINKSRAYNFSKQDRSKLQQSGVPGPGSYDHQQAGFKYGSKMEPSYGFGSRIMTKEDRSVPGPGQYQPIVNTYSKIGGIVSRDLRGSYTDSKTPGPGNYDVNYNKLKGTISKYIDKDPSYSLSKSSRDYLSNDNSVGPGQYDHDKYYKNMSSVLSSQFSKANRDTRQKQLAPGPGAYDTPLIKSRKSIRIGQKVKNVEDNYVPGPGVTHYQMQAYEALKSTSWLSGKGRYSLGKQPRLSEFKSDNPGPGAYDGKMYVISDPNGKITFGKEDRLKHIHDANPGPGHYDLKPFFADVPKYLMNNK